MSRGLMLALSLQALVALWVCVPNLMAPPRVDGAILGGRTALITNYVEQKNVIDARIAEINAKTARVRAWTRKMDDCRVRQWSQSSAKNDAELGELRREYAELQADGGSP